MRSIPRLFGVTVTTLLAIASLAACAPSATPPPSPSVPAPAPSSSPVEPIAGQSALPLDCAEVLTAADTESVVPEVRFVVDESHLLPRADRVAVAQSGVLFCGWGDEGYQGSGWSNSIEVTVSPTADTTISTDVDRFGESLTPVDAAHPTSVGDCAVGGGYGRCRIVQLRAGFRIDLQVWAQRPTDAALRASADELVERVGERVEAAGPAREVARPEASARPESRCSDPGVRAIVAARGGTGEPAVDTSTPGGGDVVVTSCRWTIRDPVGSGTAQVIDVDVIPGGAWALVALVDAIGVTGGSPAEGYVTTAGMDAFGAFRVVDDDLVSIEVPAVPGDPAAWDELLAATW